MSKTKQMLDEHRGNQPIDKNKFLDDEYQYQEYLENLKNEVGDPPPVSDCCEAPINSFKDNVICTRCKKPCNVK